MRPSSNLETRLFHHILKSSDSMNESSGSQVFRTTTGIQSGPDTTVRRSAVDREDLKAYWKS